MPDRLIMSAFLFPGQGVQAREICEYYSFLDRINSEEVNKYLTTLKETFKEISKNSDFKIKDILKDENDKNWERTDFIQPITYTLSIVTFDLLNKKSNFVLGHSLGALSALTAAGVVNFENGCKLVVARGMYMQRWSEKMNTGMCAILGLSEKKIREIGTRMGCDIALMNAPTAFVLGGERKVLSEVENEAKEMGAAKTIILNTSGAFHTKVMRDARDDFERFVEGIEFKRAEIPVVINIKGETETEPKQLKNDIIESMINPVNWIRMMDYLKKENIVSYVEVGPGNSLSALARLNGVDRDKISHARSQLE